MVVIAFTGNTFTACSQRFGSTPAPAEMARLYAEDLQWVLEKLSVLGTRVLLVGAPPNIDANDVTYWTPVNAVWEDAAARWSSGGMDISYADAGAVLSEAGAWAATLPCLPSEGPERGCTDGQIAVRAPDRLHFCPTLAPTSYGVIADCPVWSSGAWRYGQAVASAVLQHL
jgi:hypothetical protein